MIIQRPFTLCLPQFVGGPLGPKRAFFPRLEIGIKNQIFSARVTNAPECQTTLMQASFHAV